MKAYVGWVGRVQKEIDPNGFDIRINPKFELPNGEVFVGGWCRPQTDGPGLRAGALVMFAEILLDAGQDSYVKDTLAPIIKFDLDWVHSNWSSDGCDLWEEVHSNDFFWNRMSYYYSLTKASKFFTRIGDSSSASKCDSTLAAVRPTLDGHWTGSFMTESSNRQKDTATVHAFSSFEAYPITDEKVAKTIQTLAFTFCAEYPLNQADNKNKIPGMLFGRYPGDTYAGGNPWQLLTAVVAKAFYQGANALASGNGFGKVEDKNAWTELLNLPQDASMGEVISASLSAGDAVMYRLYQHCKDDNGHIAEQISKVNGKQVSANDLTWSYANILSSMQARTSAKLAMEKYQQQQQQQVIEE